MLEIELQRSVHSLASQDVRRLCLVKPTGKINKLKRRTNHSHKGKKNHVAKKKKNALENISTPW